jgi:ADP-ribose pyrophosphatase YjhB (NUDIX family)
MPAADPVRNRLRPGRLPALLLNGLHEAAMLLAGRYARLEGAHAVVRNDAGDLLLVLPIFPPREWSIPGGKVATREAPHAAAVREVLEETGLAVRVERCLMVDARRSRTTDFVFACTSIGGQLQPQPEEIAEVRWVPEAEAGTLDEKLARLLSLLPGPDEPMRYLADD